MPSIKHYHPRIHIRINNKLKTITANIPDWISDQEYINILKIGTGAKTARELVAAIENGYNDNFESRIEKPGPFGNEFLNVELSADDLI